MGFKRILAAVDYSPLCPTVVQQSIDLAQQNTAELRLFHGLTIDTVASPPPFSGEFGLSPQIVRQSYQTQQLVQEQQAQEMRDLMRHYQAIAQRQGVQAEVDCRPVEPGLGLCEAARDWSADLIVVGRRGRKGLTEAFLGSVSNYVLHHAPCSVLIIQTPGSP